jgi:thiamine pyrophosphokinase
VKLKILQEVTTSSNFSEILNELEEYVTDVNSFFAKKSIRVIGEIGMRLDAALSSVVLLLKSFINRHIDYIVSQTLSILQSKYH